MKLNHDTDAVVTLVAACILLAAVLANPAKAEVIKPDVRAELIDPKDEQMTCSTWNGITTCNGGGLPATGFTCSTWNGITTCY